MSSTVTASTRSVSYKYPTLTAFLIVGLGGTSLLNANIFLPADKKTLSLADWPADIKNNPESLDKCESLLLSSTFIRADLRM